MKILRAEINGAHRDNGADVVCPYCNSGQHIPMEENGMNKSFQATCGLCTKVFKVDVSHFLKNFHPVVSLRTK